MSFALRSTLALALACFVSPLEASAQQLYQPISVAPWMPPTAWKTPTASTAEITPTLPRLFFDATGKAPAGFARTKISQSLPMVETESFALLGQIRADKIKRGAVGPTARSIAIDPSTGVTDSFPPLGFLRASRDQTSNHASRR